MSIIASGGKKIMRSIRPAAVNITEHIRMLTKLTGG